MIPKVVILFYAGGVLLFVIGALLTRKPRSTRGKGGATYLKRKRRNLIGVTLIVGALLSIATGVLTEVFSSPNASTDSPEDVSEANAREASPKVSASTSSAPAIPSQASPSATPSAASAPTPELTAQLAAAFQLVSQGKAEAGLDAVNAILQKHPDSIQAHALRGDIDSNRKAWDDAASDFQAVLKLDPKNPQARFNLAEVSFRQAKYDEARVGFLAVEKDPDLGDLSSYKVFLCDLLGGHEDVAAKELDAFNKIGENASYYYSNVAWFVYHKKIEDARSWLVPAIKIYAPYKTRLYTASLVTLGYLPLPPPKAN
jgi:Tfp pilus assembly protein PilF